MEYEIMLCWELENLLVFLAAKNFALAKIFLTHFSFYSKHIL